MFVNDTVAKLRPFTAHTSEEVIGGMVVKLNARRVRTIPAQLPILRPNVSKVKLKIGNLPGSFIEHHLTFITLSRVCQRAGSTKVRKRAYPLYQIQWWVGQKDAPIRS
jgi:hypothetical protein